MKKLAFILILLASTKCYSQQTFGSLPYVFTVDTTVHRVVKHELGSNFCTYEIFLQGSVTRKVADIYDAFVYCFLDTLKASDVSQIGTTGIYRFTLHASALNTTKRNILVKNTIFQYDSAIFELRHEFSNSNYPLFLVRKSNNKTVLTLHGNGCFFLDGSATPQTIGSQVVKIIIN